MSERAKLKVLFLCTGNSCRSIMAEAIMNHYGNFRYQAFSAGRFPSGAVHPRSIETLKRHGVEIGNPRSKSWNEFKDQPIDVAITVCDQAADEICPIFHGNSQKLHWSIPDPAKIAGSAQEVNAAFDAAFNLIKQRIETELLS